MRANANMFAVLAVFFVLADVTYIIWNLNSSGGTHIEWVGTVGIALSAVLSFFLQFYLRLAASSTGGPLPEDRLDATIDDGEAEQGYFSPWSWWPFMLGTALALVFLGMAVGIWFAVIGAPLVILGVVGWNYEYYRGYFAR